MKMNRTRKNRTIFLVLLMVFAILVPTGSAQSGYTQTNVFSIPESEESTCHFGSSIAANERYIIIGSKSSTVEGVRNAGIVCVYDYKGNQQKIIKPDNPTPFYKFGTTVSTGNDKIIISNIEFTLGTEPGPGSVYVYDLDLTLITKIEQPEVHQTALFGWSTSVLNDKIIITEPEANTEIAPFSGRIQENTFEGDLIQMIVPSTLKTTAGYGFRVVTDHDVIVVSELNGYQRNYVNGTIHVYDQSWNEIATLYPEPRDTLNNFGFSSAVNDDYIFIGDRKAEVDGYDRAGIVYMYDKQGEFVKTIQSPAPVSGGQFANSMAVYENILVVGAPNENAGMPYSGKVYVYDLDDDSVTELVPNEPDYQGYFGQTLTIFENNIIVNEAGTEKVYHFSTEVTQASENQPEPESSLVSEQNPEDESPGIPGFPIYAIIIGLTLYLWLYSAENRSPLFFHT